MTKVAPELILDAGQLPDTGATPLIDQIPDATNTLEVSQAPDVEVIAQNGRVLPKPLPEPLVGFKKYIDSKFWYHSKPMEGAELISVQPKVAFQCHMKILMETRKLRTVTNATPMGY